MTASALTQHCMGGCEATPNPSLKLTLYGRHCKPGLSHSHYGHRTGLQRLQLGVNLSEGLGRSE
jgi:hypothetical protein